MGGNALLIFGFQMGVAGAAIATLASRVVGSVVMVLLLLRPHNMIYIDTFRRFRPDWRMVRNILAIGIPERPENGMFQIGKILVQGLVTSPGNHCNCLQCGGWVGGRASADPRRGNRARINHHCRPLCRRQRV